MKRTIILVFVLALIVMALGAGAAVAGNDKVDICHVNGSTGFAPFPPGTPTVDITYGRVISVSANAYDAHMAHGDGPVTGLGTFNPDDNPLVWVYGEAFGVAGNSNCAFNVPHVPE